MAVCGDNLGVSANGHKGDVRLPVGVDGVRCVCMSYCYEKDYSNAVHVLEKTFSCGCTPKLLGALPSQRKIVMTDVGPNAYDAGEYLYRWDRESLQRHLMERHGLSVHIQQLHNKNVGRNASGSLVLLDPAAAHLSLQWCGCEAGYNDNVFVYF